MFYPLKHPFGCMCIYFDNKLYCMVWLVVHIYMYIYLKEFRYVKNAQLRDSS